MTSNIAQLRSKPRYRNSSADELDRLYGEEKQRSRFWPYFVMAAIAAIALGAGFGLMHSPKCTHDAQLAGEC